MLGLGQNGTMSACKTLVRTSFSSITSTLRTNRPTVSLLHSISLIFSPLPSNQDEAHSADSTLEPLENMTQETMGELLRKKNEVACLMKMERRHESAHQIGGRWFLYLDKFSCSEGAFLNSGEVLEAVDPYIMDVRKDKFRKVAKNRSYEVCLVVEGLGYFGNVSAAFRSADALGFQLVHVVSCDSKRDNRHVSMGEEKWLDIEIWNSTAECFEVLKSRGYRIATTHIGRGFYIRHGLVLPNCDCRLVLLQAFSCTMQFVIEHLTGCRILSTMGQDYNNIHVKGSHGDLTFEESQILLTEFSLRHSKGSISIAREYVKRKASLLPSRI
ncbi:uncharacterized protein LOC126629492 isoform X3 [Malus sylvestris]|uniref:uncharacterized protein LOC126629492 isoform X3 n=1 Tax=Malus sylvestris TaxID=3752 RepID=UPI0021AD47FA|nr:uncharacterized protein LOC126629492 isoform X3 [Malus sylvestris]